MMLDHVGYADSAGRICKVMLACLNTDGVRTLDLGGKASITDFAQGIVRNHTRSGDQKCQRDQICWSPPSKTKASTASSGFPARRTWMLSRACEIPRSS